MGNYLNSINDEFKARKGVGIGCLISIIILFLIIIILTIETGDKNAMFTFLILTIILTFTTIIIKTSLLKIKKTEIEIIKIIIAFLKYSQIETNIIKQNILKISKVYKKDKIEKLFKKIILTETDVNKACDRLATKKSEVKYFVLSVLLDLSANDTILTINEENFIEKVRIRLLVHKKTYNFIKNAYIKQGLKEERKIIEEQNRRKQAKSFSKSFLPYKAYKILGVTPSVTKSQLKKVYRTLAKKYHPDKFYGQSDEIIQKAEDKFQEILEAYQIIKKFSGK
ncbi:MAG: DnaJ domain-containing protein [Bacteroidales bacterium]|nr:DnaJ domain-containing protein [Bacteroidales bacterium]